MALSVLAKKIKRYHEVTEQSKALEDEREALKTFFKAEAGGVDAVFEHGKLEVSVIGEQRTGWDGDKLTAHLGADAANFKKTTHSLVVRCRTKKKEAA